MNTTRPGPVLARRGLVTALLLGATACGSGAGSSTDRRGPDPKRVAEIEAALVPKNPAAVGVREGLAATLLVDVSGSMREDAPDSDDRKIDVAKRAAIDLVQQFARYAADQPAIPVLVGVYEFSSGRRGGDVREVVPMGQPRPQAAESAIRAMRADGGTPIGDAMIVAKRALDATGVARRHLIVVTDGENTDGYDPGEVATALARRPFDERPALYFVAFDIEARRFQRVRDAGGLVLEAASGKALGETIDALLRGKILVEK
jgi:hypothetical protein